MMRQRTSEMIAASGSAIEECARIGLEPGVLHHKVVRSTSKFQAVCSGILLTLYTASATFAEDTIKADLEFEHELVAACWDLSEGCVVVADVNGSLHVVTAEGDLLFSKKIVTDGLICGLKFVSNVGQSEVQTLVVVVDNGTIFCIQNMYVAAICKEQGNKSVLGGLLQKLQVQKHAIAVANKIRTVSVFESTVEDGVEIGLAYTDSEHALFRVSLGVITAVAVGAPQALVTDKACDDFFVVDAEEELYFALLDEEVLALIDPEEGQVLASVRLPSKAQGIVSVRQSSSEEEIHSYIVVLAPRRVTGSEGVVTQTIWIGQKSQTYKALHLGSSPFPAVATGHKTEIVRVEGETQQVPLVMAVTSTDLIVMRPSESMLALVQSITATVKEVAAGGSSAPTSPAAVLVDQVLQGLGPSSTSEVGGAGYFDQSIGRFGLMTSGSEVLTLLNLLLEIPQPPAGYLHKFLNHAEVAVEKVSTKQNQSAKQRWLLEILKLHHSLETAQLLLNLTPSAEEPEEALRKGLHALLPDNIAATLRLCLRSGRLQHALLITQRCVRGALPLEPAEAVQRIPDDCSLEDFITWVRHGVVERLSLFNSASPSASALAVAGELLKRAEAAEEKTGSPFVAVRLVELAKELTASIPYSISATSKEVIEQVSTLHAALELQRALWERWDDGVRLEEVTSLGLQGLVFDRIDTTEENKLIEDLRANVLPLIRQFDGNSDELLRGWIEESISTRIVLAGDEAATGVEESESCTLSRLVKVASVIEDRNVQAKMVLTLLQMPVLEEMSLRGGMPSSVPVDEDEDGETVPGEPTKRTVGSNHLASTRLLCDLAAAASDFVDGATREALTEATRLLRIKSVAASYGIESFEPRNGKQVRSVVILIANTMHRAESVRDAVEFSSSWGNSSVDMKAVLTRAIILRSTNLPLFLSQGGTFESTLRSSLCFLPSELKQIVCEDAVAFLLEELIDEADGIEYQPGQTSGAEVAEAKQRAEMLMRAAVVLCSHYLDVTREEAEEVPPAAAGSTAPKRIRSHELQEGSINSDLLQLLKRILTLQTAHDIFVSHVDIADKDVCQAVVAKLAKFRVKLLLKEVAALPETDGPKMPRITSANAPLDAHSRKVCLLLNVLPTYFTHTAMKLMVEASQTDLAMELAASLSREKTMHSSSLPLLLSTASDGLTLSAGGETGHTHENDDEAEREAALLLDAAVTLCAIAAKKANQISTEEYPMLPSLSLSTVENVIEMPEYLSFPISSFSLSRDLLRCSVSSCPSLHLGRTLDLLSGSETVLAVYDRIEGAASQVDEDRAGVSTVLAEGVFARDGILMQASSVAMPLMKYSFAEIKRRSASHSRSASASASTESAADLEDLVRILQRSENHLLASRILLGSWHSSQSKAQLLRSSLLSLCRKVLIYRDIDIPFAVASLAALTYDTMVKELKTAVPSIQSDFSRLQTVALVGEELSHLWDQEQLLVLFQGLQANAKWWHILSSLGLKFDLRVFQSPDKELRDTVVRSLIPELFEKGNMDLEMVTEYCRQFDLEPEHATLTYVDLLFTARPTVVNDFSWAGKVRSAAVHVKDRAMLQRLREVLPRVHPLDYEKVRYVCTWLIDLLSAEEVPEDLDHSHCQDDHEDLTTSFSLKSKAQKVSTAALQAERGSSHELETYRRYLEIAGYLAGLKFPTEATAAIQITALPSPYDSVNASYRERIPLWQLLEEPWSVLDPLLTHVPESAGKLAPLCLPLRLDKADFNFRKIMALYARMTNKIDADSVTPKAPSGQTELSVSIREGKRAALQATSEAIDASLTNPLQQLKLWQWIYDREVANGDDEHAMLALKAAFAVAVNHPTLVAPRESFGADAAEDSEGSTVHARLSNEMRALKCKLTVKQFNLSLTDSPGACQVLLGAISDPALLLRCMFETVIEISWDMYVRGLQQLGAPVTAYTLSESSPNQQLLEFVSTATKAIEEVAQHCGQNQPVQNGDSQSQTTYLELSRHNMIGKMLSDVETNAQGGAAGDRDPSAASTVGLFAAGQAAAKKGFWGGADEATYSPSSAEQRRREDVFLALSISVLVLTCASAAQRQAYFAQLDSVIRGKGVRVMRRLTARSKYRAAQSLFYLQSATLNSAAAMAELTSYKSYLYCLSELQEIRLPCTEESLLDAMGLKIVDFKMTTVAAGSEPSAADPKALVRTWIHDEGAHTEVVELARDLLVATRYQDAGIWFHLVGHMVAKGMHRALLQSLLMVRGAAVFADMCFGMLGSDIVASLAKVCADATARTEQVLQLAAARSGESIRQSSDWLWINQQGSASVLTPASTPTSAPGAGTAASSATAKEGVASHHRVLLLPRLAGRPGDWEEGAPEDLLPTLEQSVALSVAVLHQVSSRVRAKCDPATISLRTSCAQMLSLAVQALSSDRAVGVRSVDAAVAQALKQSSTALLTPVVFGNAKEVNAPNAELVDALNSLFSAKRGDTTKVAAFACSALSELSNKLDTSVVVCALDKHLRSKGNAVDAERLKFLLELCVAGAGNVTSASTGRFSQREKLTVVLAALIEQTLASDAAVLHQCFQSLPPGVVAELQKLRGATA